MDELVPDYCWDSFISNPKTTPFDTDVDYIEATEEGKYYLTHSKSINVAPPEHKKDMRRMTRIVMMTKEGKKIILTEEKI